MSNPRLVAESFLRDAENELLSLPKSITDIEVFEIERNLERARVNINELPAGLERDNLIHAYFALMGRTQHYRGERERRLEMLGRGRNFFQKAVWFYEQALNVRRTQYVLYEMALSLDATGEVSRAVSLMEEATRLDPESKLGVQAAKTGQIMREKGGGSAAGGCFVATACYGCIDHPDVVTLRRFRDRWLLTNRVGRLFVRVYYATSPVFADWLARHRRAADVLLRYALAPIVRILRKAGIS